VLTDEQQTDTYPVATLEDGATATEQTYYSINTGNIVANPGSLPSTYANNNGNPPYNTNPNSNTTATSAKMYKLNGNTGDKTGLGITLKVMAGDNVNIYGRSYWTGSSPNNSYSTVVNDLLTALAGTSAVANAGKGATAAALTGSGVTPNDVSNFLSTAPLVSGRPKAYINWILFDEQFRAVSSSSGFSAVNSTSGLLNTHTQGVSIAKNGYLYVYCSNESNIDVFFDNLQVIQNRGPLLEESHYYPFGLTMAGISSKAAGKLENRYKYNGGSELQNKEFSDGSGLEMYDTHFRNLDPQLGRWWQVDPKPNASESPYAAMANNPIRFNDVLGDTTKVYVFDQKDRPQDNGTKGKSYAADVYVYDTETGGLKGPYAGSSYPNSKSNKDNSTSANTLKDGEYDFNNKSGHKGSTKKGLNVVNSKGQRKTSGTSKDGKDVTMENVNVHEGASDNGNYSSRGSLGCITINPSDASDFFGNFNWTNKPETTGDSKGKIVVKRGDKTTNVDNLKKEADKKKQPTTN